MSNHPWEPRQQTAICRSGNFSGIFWCFWQTSTKFSRKTCPGLFFFLLWGGVFSEHQKVHGQELVCGFFDGESYSNHQKVTWKTWVRTVDSGQWWVFLASIGGEIVLTSYLQNSPLPENQDIYSWSLDDEDFAKQILTTSMFDRVPGFEKCLITALYLWEKATGPRDEK